MDSDELLKSLGLDDTAIKKVKDAIKPNQSKDDEIERMRKHIETLLGEKKSESDKRKAEQAEKERLEAEQAKKAGDFEAIEAQYKQKIEKLEADIAERDRKRDADLVTSESMRLASEMADNPNNREILQMIIAQRLVANDGQVKVVDVSGNPTISTMEDLKSEFIKSSKYDSLITGSKASGVGSTGTGGAGDKSPSDYTEAERVKMASENPNLFKQLFGE